MNHRFNATGHVSGFKFRLLLSEGFQMRRLVLSTEILDKYFIYIDLESVPY